MILGKCHDVINSRNLVYLAVLTSARYDSEGASRIKFQAMFLGRKVVYWQKRKVW